MRKCGSEKTFNNTEPKFPFKKRPKSGFLLFNLTEDDKFNFNNNNKKNNIKTKSLKELREDWKRKIPLNFSNNERKFAKAKILPEVIKSKNLIKEMVKPDILQLKKPKWNNSVILEKRIDFDSIYDLSILNNRKFTNYSFNDHERTNFRKFSRQKFLKALYGENKKKKKEKRKKKEKFPLLHYNTIETKKTNFRNVKKISFEEIKIEPPLNSKKIIFNLKEDLNPKNKFQIDNIKNRNFIQRRSKIRPETTLNNEMVKRLLNKHANQLLNSSRSFSDNSNKKDIFQKKIMKTKTKFNIPIPSIYNFSKKNSLNEKKISDDILSNKNLIKTSNNSLLNNINENILTTSEKNSSDTNNINLKSEKSTTLNNNIKIINQTEKDFKPFTDELLVDKILTIESIKNEINPYHKKVNVLLPLVHLSKKIEKEEKYLIEENRKKNKICEALGKKKKEKLISKLDAFKLAYKKIYRNCVSEIKKQEDKIKNNYYEFYKHPGIYVYIFYFYNFLFRENFLKKIFQVIK